MTEAVGFCNVVPWLCCDMISSGDSPAYDNQDPVNLTFADTADQRRGFSILGQWSPGCVNFLNADTHVMQLEVYSMLDV